MGNHEIFINNALQVAVVIILITMIAGIILGLFDKAVYYYDIKDLVYTFIPLVSIIAFLFIISVNSGKSTPHLIGHYLFLSILEILLLLTGAFFFMVTVGSTFKSNNNHVLISMVVLISKILFSIIITGVALAIFLSSIQSAENKEKKDGGFTQDIICLGVLGFFGFFIKKLINGGNVVLRSNKYV
ncbi:MAG: hypothetical protein ACYCSW_11265 [bacterium]